MTVSEQQRRRKGRFVATAHTVPPEIQWHEGMLLMPQHFQQLARRQESLLHYHAAAMSPFHWGVRLLKIDRALLPDGVFRVLELEAIMPDGLAVSSWSEEAAGLTLDLAARGDEAKMQPTRIHLAITANGRGLPLSERYRTGDVAVVDENDSAASDVQVPILRPKLQLIAGDEPPAKYVSFPLAEVEYRDETFVTTRYEPPWLHVAPGSQLYDLCVGISSRVRGKAGYLADQARSLPGSSAALQIAETKALVHDLVGALPPFEALLRSGVSHPFPLYLALCGLVGHAAGLSRALVPPLFEPYDHNDLYATFEQAHSAITRALNEGAHEAYTTYRFVRDGDTYRLRFDPDWMTRSLVLGVRSQSGAPKAEIEKWMDATVIGGDSKMLSLRERRVLGARRRHLEADADLAPPHGVSLFTLWPDAEFVVPGEELVIVNPGGGRRPEEIVLYVRNRA
jgi:type VI secretion system protein ImpJ